MVLPLYLAATAEELADTLPPPRHLGWMACHFSRSGTGVCDLPEALPPGAMLILNDRFCCRDHDPKRIAGELAAAVERLSCESVLLDFEREPTEASKTVADALFQVLPCPVAAPPGFIEDSRSAVFLPFCPLHVPLEAYLRPWQGRNVWLEAALLRQAITVSASGTVYGPTVSVDGLDGRHFDETLLCRYRTEVSGDSVRFTLFDTPDTLREKLDRAAALGVSRAVGLYQELSVAFCPSVR